MSKQVSFGYTDTAISGVTALDLPRGLINFGADFDVVKEKASELTLVNLTTPISKPESFKFAYSVVPDIYKGTGIAESARSVNTSGVSVLVQLNEIGTITDSEDPDYEVLAPVQYHMVIRVPAIEQITENHIMTGVGRLTSGLFDTGSEANLRLKKILRGALKPSDI